MLFSIIIPTRNHPDTLASTLATCAHASWADVEVVVFDNSDPVHQPAVAACVENAGCPWFRYVKSPESPCSMSRNWSLAFKEARGDYVTFLGDDDGFLEFSLPAVKTIIEQSGADAVTWPAALYMWPTTVTASRQGRLTLYFGTQCGNVKWTHYNGRSAIAFALRNPRQYDTLPMVYNSFVHRSVIAKARQTNDDIFISQSPDVYSGLFVAAFATQVVRADTSLSVRGVSGHSNGVATMTAGAGTEHIRKDFESLNGSTPWKNVRGAASVGVYASQVADSFSRFAECYPEAVHGIALNPQRLAFCQATEVLSLYDDQATRSAAVATSREYYAKDQAALRAISGVLANPPTLPAESATYGLGDGVLHLRGNEFGASDIASACQVVDKLLSLCDVSRKVTPQGVFRRLARELSPPLLLKAWHKLRHR